MRIDSLKVENFRCFTEAEWEFSPGFNVLIGDNGSGKTAVLDALAVAVGSFFWSIKRIRHRKIIREKDMLCHVNHESENPFLEYKKFLNINTKIEMYNESILLHRSISKGNIQIIKSNKPHQSYIFGELTNLSVELDNMKNKYNNSQNFDINKVEKIKYDLEKSINDSLQSMKYLPLITLYSAGRAWLKPKPNHLRFRGPQERIQGYADCLEEESNEQFLYDWFTQREIAALQKNGASKTMEGIRQAVCTCLGDDWTRVWYDIDLAEVMAEHKDNGSLPVRLLSDGQRSILAMGLDMAYRCAVLNPHLAENASQETPGVVLIDEIDLHLHPKWQREIVGNLRRAFPKVQFFVTTHSPIIIQSLDPKLDRVIDLSGDEFPLTVRSSPEDILERMGMEIPQQSAAWIQLHQTAKEYYDLLDQAKETQDEVRIAELRAELDRLSIPFEDNPAWAALLTRKRAVSGIDA